MSKAVGFVETKGFAAMVEATDAMAKAAKVEIVPFVKIDAGLVTSLVRGDVASVRAATEAAKAAASRIGEVIAVHVIPAPHGEVDEVLPLS